MDKDALVMNLQKDIAVLQNYVNGRIESGLADMPRMIESLSIILFRAVYGYNLVNTNKLQTNFPAIDLADDAKRVAIQVTTNADMRKVKKTINKFEELNFCAKYDKLIIIGFCKHTSGKSDKDYCKIVGIADIVGDMLDHCTVDKIQDVCNAIRQHNDYNRLHPWDDIQCLKIVLSYIDRNAIKHRMSCEGSARDMLAGLKEISELIGKGTVNGVVKSKCAYDFTDVRISTYLRNVNDAITDISAVVNKHRINDSDFACIDHNGMELIDEAKNRIADMTNEIALLFGISMRVFVR